MKFGTVRVDDALGAVIAHTLRRDGLVIKKGERLTAERLAGLRATGVVEIVAAQAEPGDVDENAAAAALAKAVSGAGLRVEAPFTGRANAFAETAGVLLFDVAALDRVNAIDESVTIATLPAFRAVVAGEMVATVKIIPFAIPGALVEHAAGCAADVGLRVAPYRALRVGVISTLLPGLKPSIVDKTLRVMAARLAPAGAGVVADIRVDHTTPALAQALVDLAARCDLAIVFGASAITDRRDVIPAAIEAAGGRIEQFGMPVDPGNLLLLGRLAAGTIVLGAPGCARSPKENGFDWVLQRILADIPVTAADIRRMGAGGLLMEIVSRGQPRTGEETQDEEHHEEQDG